MERINFKKNIYSKKAIDLAINEFKNLANFKVEDTSGYWSVSMEILDQDVAPVLADEFANYVLGVRS